MTDKVASILRLRPDEPIVEFPAEGQAVSVPLTPVGERLYRLDAVPGLVESAAFGDVIEAEPGENGRLRFIRVARPGGWRTIFYMVPDYKIQSEWGQTLVREFEARGGHWECLLGGLLFVCIPPGVDFDPTPWVETF